MSEAEYEHECERAELLGIPKPSRDEFLSRKQEHDSLLMSEENKCDEQENKELHQQGESIKRAAGGLDEINSILLVTQKKINHMKTLCGSFTGILKLRSSKKNSNSKIFGTGEKELSGLDASSSNLEKHEVNEDSPRTRPKTGVQTDMESTICSQIDRLDDIILKAEKAEVSLSCQNKQMKKFLSK